MEDAGNNQYKFSFGEDGETVSLDGEPHMTKYGNTWSVTKGETDFKLDGKDYTPKGPQVPKGITVSGKKIDDRNMELTYKLNGKTNETDHWQLSDDGKTLTNTVTYPGIDKQEVDIFERQ